MPTDTQVNDLKINVLTEAQYEQIASPSPTELYLVPDVVDTTPTSGSTNPITSGGVYAALQNIPEQEQSDWSETDTTDPAYIKNKPKLGSAAAKNVPSSGNASTTEVVMGNDSRLTDARKPTAHTHGNITNDGKVGSASGKILTTGAGGAVQASDSITKSMISDFPSLAKVATSGSYNDLSNKPTIPSAPVQSNWNETDTSSLAYIENKPTIPAAQVNSDWNASSGVAQILNKPNLATVATSGDYDDLTNKPTIPDDSSLVHLSGEETITGAKTIKEDFTLKSTSANSPSPFLILQRGTLSDEYVDWKINNDGGYFNFYRSYNGIDVLKFRLYNTGNDFTNLINAPFFVKTNPTYATGILLADGSDIPQDTFQPSLPSYTGNSGKILAVNSGADNVEWINKPSEGASQLNDLSDVTISSAADQQTLVYNPDTQNFENGELRKLWKNVDIVSKLDTEYVSHNGYIYEGSGNWNPSSTYKHWAVPVKDMAYVTIQANSSLSVWYTFFSSYTARSNTNPLTTYATGYTTTLEVQKNTSATIRIPSNALYMYLNTGNNSVAKASHVYLTGIASAIVQSATIYNGSSTPSSSVGRDGDIYIQTT